MFPPDWSHAPANHNGGIPVNTLSFFPVSFDLKTIAESDLVYLLTEIDSGAGVFRGQFGSWGCRFEPLLALGPG
jgi:hypothetical protein